MHRRVLVGVALLGIAAGCGGDNNGNIIENSCAPLSINPSTDLVKIKASEAFTVTCTGSTVTGTWGCDNTAVATVDSSGRATGVASGQATVFADYRGQRATRLLRVVPDYHGGWRGDWSVTACAEEGGWTGVCGEFPNGSLWLLILSITQNRDTVTGTTDFGDMKGPVNGTIRTTGHLVLTGTYNVTLEGITVEVTLSEWETTTTDNERMTGRFRVSFRAAGIQGSFRLDGDLRIVTKTSATPLAGAPGDGASVSDAMRWILRRQ